MKKSGKAVIIIALILFSVLTAMVAVYAMTDFYSNSVFKNSEWISENGDVELNIKTNKVFSIEAKTGTFNGTEIYYNPVLDEYVNRETGEPMFTAYLELKGLNKLMFHINYDKENASVIELRRKVG